MSADCGDRAFSQWGLSLEQFVEACHICNTIFCLPYIPSPVILHSVQAVIPFWTLKCLIVIYLSRVFSQNCCRNVLPCSWAGWIVKRITLEVGLPVVQYFPRLCIPHLGWAFPDVECLVFPEIFEEHGLSVDWRLKIAFLFILVQTSTVWPSERADWWFACEKLWRPGCRERRRRSHFGAHINPNSLPFKGCRFVAWETWERSEVCIGEWEGRGLMMVELNVGNHSTEYIVLLELESIRQYCDIDRKSWPLWYRKQSAADDIVSHDLYWHPTVRARCAVISISDLHQNDTRIGCLVAQQTTDHWAHATGPWLGCDMTHHDFSYKEGNAVCVQLAPPHSYAPLASASSSAGCWGRWSLVGGYNFFSRYEPYVLCH